MRVSPEGSMLLPAQRIDGQGRSHVDSRAILTLAGPLMVNAAIQAALNLTDTWFVGRISTTAVTAMASIYWVVLCAILLLGGIGMAVQTFAAQAYGSGRRARAAQAGWSGVYAGLLTIPLFAAIGCLGSPLLHALQVDPEVRDLALAYWWPRLAVGGPLGLLVWSLTAFFNGIGRTRISLVVAAAVAIANVLFNQWFIFGLHGGIAGSAWGTVAAEVVGLVFALSSFLGEPMRRVFHTGRTWRRPMLRRQFVDGLPMGLSTTADLVGLALFQLMLVTASNTAGAATQIVMMLTSVAYMPAIGIGLAGTTLVGAIHRPGGTTLGTAHRQLDHSGLRPVHGCHRPLAGRRRALVTAVVRQRGGSIRCCSGAAGHPRPLAGCCLSNVRWHEHRREFLSARRIRRARAGADRRRSELALLRTDCLLDGVCGGSRLVS